MLNNGNHRVFWAEVEAVTGEPDAPRYTLVSITPGVSWRRENLAPRAQSTGAEVIAAEQHDLCVVYDRNGEIRPYLWEGTPFDPCEDGNVQGGGGPGLLGRIANGVRNLFGTDTPGGNDPDATDEPGIPSPGGPPGGISPSSGGGVA